MQSGYINYHYYTLVCGWKVTALDLGVLSLSFTSSLTLCQKMLILHVYKREHETGELRGREVMEGLGEENNYD